MLFRHDGVCSNMTSDLMISILIGILRPAIHGALTGDRPPGAAGSLTGSPPPTPGFCICSQMSVLLLEHVSLSEARQRPKSGTCKVAAKRITLGRASERAGDACVHFCNIWRNFSEEQKSKIAPNEKQPLCSPARVLSGESVKLKIKVLNNILLQSTHNVFLSFFHVPADLLIPFHHQ